MNYCRNNNIASASVECRWHRTFDRSDAWLITLDISPDFGDYMTCYPQARAVMDDFGTLVVVRAWQ